VTFWRRVSNHFNPTSKDYWISVGFICLFGIIMTVLSLLLSALWTPLRQAKLLGGFEPMDGFCWYVL
jgi:hypothetical protein